MLHAYVLGTFCSCSSLSHFSWLQSETQQMRADLFSTLQMCWNECSHSPHRMLFLFTAVQICSQVRIRDQRSASKQQIFYFQILLMEEGKRFVTYKALHEIHINIMKVSFAWNTYESHKMGSLKQQNILITKMQQQILAAMSLSSLFCRIFSQFKITSSVCF